MLEFVINIFENEKYAKRITTCFIAFVVIVTSFFITSAIKMYHTKIKPLNELKLIYEFKPNTIKYQAFNDTNISGDISEKFLSYGVSYGIDVSEWQGSIDWEKVKATGISFAMIRCGFRQIEGSEVIEDATFRQNIEGATKAGLKVGVYFFGTAKNEREAIEEAEFTVNLIKDYHLTYPVVYDIETFNSGRLKNIGMSTITNNVLAFTETVGSFGYETMIYSFKDALSYYLDMGRLEGKLIWLAHWVNKTDYNGQYHMWQYSDSGRVDGIKTNVDLNISYFDYVDDEDKIIPSPDGEHSTDVSFTPVEEEVKTIKSATIRTSPTSTIPNKLGTVKKNTTMLRTGISEKYSRVIYDGRTVYILNKDIRLSS